MNVLVAGATGYIGGRLVPRLLAAGRRVRCMARAPSRLAGRPRPGVEIVAGEALRATGTPVTEFRAAVIVGSGSLPFEMIRHLAERRAEGAARAGAAAPPRSEGT